MSQSRQYVPLHELLSKSEERISLNPEDKYREITIKLWGKGVTLRREVIGAEIASGIRFVARKQQFIVSRIDARNGAFGLVPDALDGAAVTNDFPVFSLNTARLLPRYLEWFSKTADFVDLCKAASEGTTNRIRLKEGRFLAAMIPLPTLEEQRRIVARIEELTAKIEEARGLRQESSQEVGDLLPRTLSQILNDNCWEFYLLEKVLAESPRNGLAPQAEVADGEIPMLRINAVSSSPTRFVDTSACKMVNIPPEIARPFIVKNDDVFIVRYNGDINRVAKAAVFKSQEPVTIVFPDKLMRLRPDQSKVTPDFLIYALGCQSVRSQIEELGKTTAGQIGVSGKDAKSFRIPVPPVEEQHRLVAYFDNLQVKVDTIKRIQAETSAKINALLPSILDKAFKGEL